MACLSHWQFGLGIGITSVLHQHRLVQRQHALLCWPCALRDPCVGMPHHLRSAPAPGSCQLVSDVMGDLRSTLQARSAQPAQPAQASKHAGSKQAPAHGGRMEEKHGGTWRLVGVGRVATGPGGSVPSCLTFVLSRPILSNLTVSCLVLSLMLGRSLTRTVPSVWGVQSGSGSRTGHGPMGDGMCGMGWGTTTTMMIDG